MSKVKTNAATASVAMHMQKMVKSVMNEDIGVITGEVKKLFKKVKSLQTLLNKLQGITTTLNGEVEGIKEAVSQPATPVKKTNATTTTTTKKVENVQEEAQASSSEEDSDSEPEDDSDTVVADDLTVTFTPADDADANTVLWNEYINGDTKRIVFFGLGEEFDQDTVSEEFDKVSKYHYVVSVDGAKTDKMSMDKFVEVVHDLCQSHQEFDIEFKEMTKTEQHQYDQFKMDQDIALRKKLWKQYQMFFSDSYRQKNRKKHSRYRPDSKSCGNRSAIDTLYPLVQDQYRKICTGIDKLISIDELYKKMDEADEEEWKEMIRKASPHTLLKKRDRDGSSKSNSIILDEDEDAEIMSIPDPRKKQKTLRDEFIEAGKGPATMFDQLKEKFDETAIRAMFGL
tara:strand:- start:158 stop:1351 length:1194 start_codon:yes stop_codon:yes gene_type:complete